MNRRSCARAARWIAATGLLFAVAGAAGSSAADDEAAEAARPAATEAAKPAEPEPITLDELAKDLGLTEEQQKQAAPLVRTHDEKLAEIRKRREQGQLPGLAGLKAYGQARREFDEHLEEILTPAQRDEWHALRQRDLGAALERGGYLHGRPHRPN